MGILRIFDTIAIPVVRLGEPCSGRPPSEGDMKAAINAKGKRFNELTSRGCPTHEGEVTTKGHYRQIFILFRVTGYISWDTV